MCCKMSRQGAKLKFGILWVTTILVGTATAHSQDQPLGDVARAARTAKPASTSSKVPPKTITNDDLPSSPGAAAGSGDLSPDKKEWCDELRKRKDPLAEQACTILGLDMGAEYEETTARYMVVAKSLCAANHGRLPTSCPGDAALAAQWRELNDLCGKFDRLKQAQMKSFSDAEAAQNAIQQEEFREFSHDVPDLRNTEAVLANPGEKQRFIEIRKKYSTRLQEAETGSGQSHARALRIYYDMIRMGSVCER